VNFVYFVIHWWYIEGSFVSWHVG